MLVLTTLLWGLSFPLMKNWQNAAQDCPGGVVIASLTIIALRAGLALLLLAVVQPSLVWTPSRREHATGMLVGFTNTIGFTLQVWGLSETTPALSAFLTSLASAWVPLLAWLWWRWTVTGLTLLGLSVGISGAAVLAGIDAETGWALGRGETLTLLSSGIFAVAILLLDRLGRSARPGHLTIGFLTATGLPALILSSVATAWGPGTEAWLHWTASMMQTPPILRDFLLLHRARLPLDECLSTPDCRQPGRPDLPAGAGLWRGVFPRARS
jgi:drug/metabolite transporter (DMT)-like permease